MSYTAEQVADLENIRAAATRYCRGIDRLDAETLRSAYWPDAVDERSDLDIASYADKAMIVHRPFLWTMHCIHNFLVEFEPAGTTARGELYVIAHLRSDDPPRLGTFFGRYLDLYEKRGDEWRILRRVCVHEDSQMDAATPTPWSFDHLRRGSADRPTAGRPLGP